MGLEGEHEARRPRRDRYSLTDAEPGRKRLLELPHDFALGELAAFEHAQDGLLLLLAYHRPGDRYQESTSALLSRYVSAQAGQLHSSPP